jgi:hypothetical protein
MSLAALFHCGSPATMTGCAGLTGLVGPQIVAEARYIGGEFLALAEQARIDCNKAMPDIPGCSAF